MLNSSSIKHGMAGGVTNKVHPLYKAYYGMKARCYNTKDKRYKDYGGRGIVVCSEWMSSFLAFYDWAINNGWRRGITLDRINNNGNYEPSNCRWVSLTVQNRNRRFNVNIIAFGEKKCLQEWFNDKRCFVSAPTILNRIKKGISPELAITLKKNDPYVINF